jgi:hypothetical protein
VRVVTIPPEVFAAEIRAGRIDSGDAASALGVAGAIAAGLASEGLYRASQESEGQCLFFPAACCNCLREGTLVQPIESVSVVNRAVAYTFRFPVPHCPDCARTANRKRPGVLGYVGAALGLGVPAGIVIAGFGSAYNLDVLIYGAILAGPALGAALMLLWVTLVRRPRGRQASAYQAVYATGIDVILGGTPSGFDLVFENAAYADRFIALNRKAGVRLRSQ